MKDNYEVNTNEPSFTCPECGMTSYHPKDIEYGYCGNCHEFTGEKNNLFAIKTNTNLESN